MLVIFPLHIVEGQSQPAFCTNSFDQVTSSTWVSLLEILGRAIQTVPNFRRNHNTILHRRETVTTERVSVSTLTKSVMIKENPIHYQKLAASLSIALPYKLLPFNIRREKTTSRKFKISCKKVALGFVCLFLVWFVFSGFFGGRGVVGFFGWFCRHFCCWLVGFGFGFFQTLMFKSEIRWSEGAEAAQTTSNLCTYVTCRDIRWTPPYPACNTRLPLTPVTASYWITM